VVPDTVGGWHGWNHTDLVGKPVLPVCCAT
jgi:hypothetical protein